MAIVRPVGDLLHRLTHRVPGVPSHAPQPTGHQGPTPRASLNRRWNHSPARPPRVLVAWQRRVAAFFGAKPPDPS
jgi:hypothetical protein